MRKKQNIIINGFTLIEVLITIVLLSTLLLIAIPNINKVSTSIKTRTYESKKDVLEVAAELYAQDNPEVFGSSLTASCDIQSKNETCITVRKLIEENYAKKELKFGDDDCDESCGCIMNPIDNKSINDEYILVKRLDNGSISEWNGKPSPSDDTMYDLFLNTNGGLITSGTSPAGKYKEGTIINISSLQVSKQDCKFLSWSVTGTGTKYNNTTKEITMGSGMSTLKANYDCSSLTLTVNLNGGEITSGDNPSGNYLPGAEIDLSGINVIKSSETATCSSFSWKVTSGDATLNSNSTKLTMGSTSAVLTAIIKCQYIFPYKGSSYELEILTDGQYKIELWGGNGGYYTAVYGATPKPYQYGASYTKGIINLSAGDKIYINVGGRGCNDNTDYCDACNVSGLHLAGGWNGGGYGHWAGCGITWGGGHPGGGGATDVRINENTLNARIMVAAASGGAEVLSIDTAGGGLANYPGNATQIQGYLRGEGEIGYSGDYVCTSECWWGLGGNPTSGSGSGYMGAPRLASANYSISGGSGYGGSSYISGHKGSIAIDQFGNSICTETSVGATSYVGSTNIACSKHYSNKVFTETVMIDGAGYSWTNKREGLVQMPNPSGGLYLSGYGHTDNGYAIITEQ